MVKKDDILNEHKEMKDMTRGKQPMFWKYATVVLAVVLVLTVYSQGMPFTGENQVTGDAVKVGDDTFNFVKEYMLPPDTSAVMNSITEANGMFLLDLTINGQEFESYISPDGEMLFPSGVNMAEMAEGLEAEASTPAQQPQATNVPKSDKPVVELFWMAECPYGTQAAKGLIPTIEAFGDSVDFKLRFVYYAMHGEREVREQLNQYCIQEEEPEKLLPYLREFLEDGDDARALEAAGINKAKLASCVAAADKEFSVTANLEDKASWLSGRFPKFDVDAGLNQQYEVQGSPTVVINGVQVSVGRDSLSYFNAIVDAFNEAPTITTELPSSSPSPGFGWSGSGANSAATCG